MLVRASAYSGASSSTGEELSLGQDNRTNECLHQELEMVLMTDDHGAIFTNQSLSTVRDSFIQALQKDLS